MNVGRDKKLSCQMESQWVQKICEGDTDAFRELFCFYCQSLIYFANRYVKDIHISENIVQDVFLKVWSNRSKLDSTLSIKAYLYKAVRNRSLKHLKHLKIENRDSGKLMSLYTKVRTPEDEWHNIELNRAIHQTINKLPTKCRIIFCMNRFDYLTYAEIAEIQNISVKTVETHMGRALKFLRKHLSHFLTTLITF